MHAVAKRLVVLRHADVIEREKPVLAREAVEIVEHERARDFARAVRAEVEEDHAVVCRNLANGFAVFHYDGRQHELVRFALVVAILHGFLAVLRRFAFAIDQRGIGLFHALKAVVAIHRVVTPHNGCDLADTDLLQLLVELFHVALAAARGHVAPVHKAMDKHLLEPLVARKLDQRVEMRVVRVYAAVREQAHQVQRGIVLFAVFNRREEGFVVEEIAIRNCLRDAGQFLIDDPPRANVEVADFAVAHLAIRQANIHAARGDLRMRILLP